MQQEEMYDKDFVKKWQIKRSLQLAKDASILEAKLKESLKGFSIKNSNQNKKQSEKWN
jgi:hypothetical protein